MTDDAYLGDDENELECGFKLELELTDDELAAEEAPALPARVEAPTSGGEKAGFSGRESAVRRRASTGEMPPQKKMKPADIVDSCSSTEAYSDSSN